MSAASLTPRVRGMVICDGVTESLVEEAAFNLEGVRTFLSTESFPCRAELDLFLLLSSTQTGTYEGKVLVIDDVADTCLRYVKFPASFHQANVLVPLAVAVGVVSFPQPGEYTFQVYFLSKKSEEALKGELPLRVLSLEG